MKALEHERRDWFIILLILLFGLLFMLLAGGWALHFTSHWELDANMESMLDPNSDFLTRRPSGFIEPVDPAILTNPAWINVFLTPSALFSTGTPLPTVTSFVTQKTNQTPFNTPTLPTIASVTHTVVVIASPTKAIIYYPASPTFTPKPKSSSTDATTTAPTPTIVSSPTPIATLTSTSTPTSIISATPTSTATPTLTSTPAPTYTFANTPDLSEPDFGGPDGNAIGLGNGMSFEFNLSGFFLDGNSTWDVVYYEKEAASPAGHIRLGAVLIEVYDETTASWYTIYNWGDGIADTNAGYNNGNSEPDGFPVDKSLVSGVPPLNTGVAIDIDTPPIGQGGSIGDSITKIRITSLSNSDCDIDALQMLR